MNNNNPNTMNGRCNWKSNACFFWSR